jgi:uncharacterized protein YdaU (DUF1376 family)
MSDPVTTWMPLYIGDYVRDTLHLSMTQHGMYLLLLMKMWADGGKLPSDNMDLLRRKIGATKQDWESSGEVLAFFYVKNGWLRNKRLDQEFERATRLSEAKRSAGKRAHEKKKWRKESYSDWLQTSPDWDDIRQRVRQRSDDLCEACLSAKAVDVHHTTYAMGRLPPAWLLRHVCRDCHDRFHMVPGDEWAHEPKDKQS